MKLDLLRDNTFYLNYFLHLQRILGHLFPSRLKSRTRSKRKTVVVGDELLNELHLDPTLLGDQNVINEIFKWRNDYLLNERIAYQFPSRFFPEDIVENARKRMKDLDKRFERMGMALNPRPDKRGRSRLPNPRVLKVIYTDLLDWVKHTKGFYEDKLKKTNNKGDAETKLRRYLDAELVRKEKRWKTSVPNLLRYPNPPLRTGIGRILFFKPIEWVDECLDLRGKGAKTVIDRPVKELALSLTAKAFEINVSTARTVLKRAEEQEKGLRILDKYLRKNDLLPDDPMWARRYLSDLIDMKEVREIIPLLKARL